MTYVYIFRFPRNVASSFTYADLESTMKYHRRRAVLPVPRSLEDLDDILQNFADLHGIYRGQVRGDDGSYAFVFIHPALEDAIRYCSNNTI